MCVCGVRNEFLRLSYAPCHNDYCEERGDKLKGRISWPHIYLSSFVAFKIWPDRDRRKDDDDDDDDDTDDDGGWESECDDDDMSQTLRIQ